MQTSVYFAYDSDKLNEKSITKLDSLANLKSKLTFRIFGNCDTSGTDEYNKILSGKRAKSVTDYLKKKIGSNITIGNSVGLGETKQINDNSTEVLREKNRRVDIFIEKSFLTNEKILRKQKQDFFSLKVAEMKAKDTFSLPNMNFYGGRHIWFPKAEPTLMKLVKTLKDHPKIRIELQGYICCDYVNFDGEDVDLGTFNLSFTRANAVRDFLIKNGIDSKRINAVGFGHQNPLVYPEVTENDMMRNRRVEVVLVGK